MSNYEKSSMVTYSFYFINRQSIHKTNCIQRIKNILMGEVFPAIALNGVDPDQLTDYHGGLDLGPNCLTY